MTRAVKDEDNLTSYCLNCISKHNGTAHLLLKEVENRIQTGGTVDDSKIKKKMKEVMENLAHIEDHTMVQREVSNEEQSLLNDIAIRANQVRGRLKDQKWDNLSKRSKSTGNVMDIQWMRTSLWDLHKVNDEGRHDFGCGDCKIDTLIPKPTIKVNRTSIDFSKLRPSN